MVGKKTIYNRFSKCFMYIPFIKRLLINIGKTLQMNTIMSHKIL